MGLTGRALHATLIAVLSMLVCAAAASAGTERWPKSDYMTGETSLTSTHFEVHYVQGTGQDQLTLAEAQQMRDWLEDGYAKLVTGGGGTPNAGMSAPVSDAASTEVSAGEADGRIDVYMAHVHDHQDLFGLGATGGDLESPWASWIVLNPRLTEGSRHYWAHRELMKVLQGSYAHQQRENHPAHTNVHGWLTNSTATWATAFTGLEPGVTDLSSPWTPIDCSYGEWEGQSCNSGNGRWLFLQFLAERHGDDLIARAWGWLDYFCPSRCADDPAPGGDKPHFDALRSAVGYSPKTALIEDEYREFAYAMWRPETWKSDHMERLRPPHWKLVQLRRPGDVTDVDSPFVDHLATRYIRIARPRVVDGRDVRGDGTRIEVNVSLPSGVSPPKLLVETTGGRRDLVEMDVTGNQYFTGYTKTLPFDGDHRDIVVSLVNDTLEDNKVFYYEAHLLPAEDGGGDQGGAGDAGGAGNTGGSGGSGSTGDAGGTGSAGGAGSGAAPPASPAPSGPAAPQEPEADTGCDEAKSGYADAKRALARAKRAVRRAKSATAKRRAKVAYRRAVKRMRSASGAREASCEPYEISRACGRATDRMATARTAYSRAKSKLRAAGSARSKRQARVKVKRAKRKYAAARKARARVCS